MSNIEITASTWNIDRWLMKAEDHRITYLGIFRNELMTPVINILKDACPEYTGKLKKSIEAVPNAEGFDILMYYYGRVQDDRTGWISSTMPKIERTLEIAVEELLDRIAEE